MFLWSKLSAARWEDAWEERFAGHPGLVIRQFAKRPTICVEVYCQSEQEAEEIQRMWGGSLRKVPPKNWAKATTPQIKPIKIRDSLLIVSDSKKEKLAQLQALHPNRQLISIPIEMAFGTGDHATTSSMLRLLADESKRRNKQGSWTMLDVGCGSGILGIAAAKLGATQVSGFDYDAHAVRVAQQNAQRNEIKANFHEQDLHQWQPQAQAELIAANVFADALIAAMPRLKQALKAEGTLLISGILDEHLEAVLKALKQSNLQLDEHLSKTRWQTLRCSHQMST